MVFQALSDLYFGSVYYANRNIRRTLAKHGTTHLQYLIFHEKSCLRTSSPSPRFLGVPLYFYRAEYHDYASIFLLSVHPIS